ncbi:Lysine--tRNA ligase [bacterium HR19]|nr:Lysine--tRNA ligase [bacterium HR19]
MVESEFEVRLKKLRELERLGLSPYKQKFKPNTTAKEIKEKFQHLKPGEHEEKENFKISGRILTIRDFGGSVFFHIIDSTDKIQCFIEKRGNEQILEFFKKLLDTGDIVGISGTVFRTKKGEITIYVRDIKVLAKCLHPLPEKWHGLKEIETRLRMRYLDLIMNPEVKQIFIKRHKIVSFIREFLTERGFIEVETPILQPVPSGAVAKPFKTYHNELEMNLFLRIAPELYLKRLIIGGFEKVFEIGRNFRNEGVSSHHNPEFTMIELYQAYSDYNDLIELTEKLITELSLHVNGKCTLKQGEEEIEFSTPFPKISIKEEVIKRAGIPAEKIKDTAFLKEKLKGKIEIDEDDDWGEIIVKYFEKYVADNLKEPTFVIDFPTSTSPLAKRKEDDPDFVERFELYAFGMEIANAFSELNDPEDQKKRFEEQIKIRRMRELVEDMDWDFVKALEHGMPPTAGEGIGIDRLVMLLTGAQSIKEVILFPTMKPEDKT